MVKPIQLLNLSFTEEELEELQTFLDTSIYWDLQTTRTVEGSPHANVSDIWARWIAPGSDWKDKQSPDFLWYYPRLTRLVKPKVDWLMKQLGSTELGGVLITRIPPGQGVAKHIDRGWHAETYEKFCICVKANEQQAFCFDDAELRTKTGDIFEFRNDVTHWVTNESTEDRISLIVCLKRECNT